MCTRIKFTGWGHFQIWAVFAAPVFALFWKQHCLTVNAAYICKIFSFFSFWLQDSCLIENNCVKSKIPLLLVCFNERCTLLALTQFYGCWIVLWISDHHVLARISSGVRPLIVRLSFFFPKYIASLVWLSENAFDKKGLNQLMEKGNEKIMRSQRFQASWRRRLKAKLTNIRWEKCFN